MSLEVGKIVEGKVTGITNFGAFVVLEGGVSGMVHISEISTEYVNDINDHVKVGQTVEVAILGKDDKGRWSLSILRALLQKPKPVSFEDLMSKFKQDSDEKLVDYKRASEFRKGGARRGK